MVHVEAGALGATAGPCAPDRLEAVGDRALHVRQRADPAGLVADDAQLPDLRQRDEALVGGVLLGDREVEQHVLGRLEPRQGELAQPPEVEAAPDHRVDAPDQVVFNHAAVVGRPEREVGGRPVRAGADGDRDAPDAADDVELLDQRPEPGGLLLDVVGRLGPGQVEVDDALVTRGRGVDLAGDRVDQPAAGLQLADLPDRRDEVRRPVVEEVVGDGERPPVDRGRRQVVQLVLAVVPPDEDLEHRLGRRACRSRAAPGGTGRSARGWRRARRSARRGPRRPAGRRAAPPARAPTPERPHARRRRAAGRTSGTARSGPGRRRWGTAAGWRARAGPAPPARPRPGPGRRGPVRSSSAAGTP